MCFAQQQNAAFFKMHIQMVSVRSLDMQACGDASRPEGENPCIFDGNVTWLQGLNH